MRASSMATSRRLPTAQSGKPTLTVKSPSGETVTLEASFVSIATGINAHCGSDHQQRWAHRLDPAVESRRSFPASRERPSSSNSTWVRTTSSATSTGRSTSSSTAPKNLAFEHTALIPKGRFLTVAMIGKCMDEAVLPRDSQRIVRNFLTLPQIDRILPGIAAAPLACACAPRMTVTTAAFPFGDRFAIIGDAVGSRLNKDGLYSAHVTASRLAETVLHEGIDQQALARGYGKTVKWLVADNRFGRMVFAASRVAFTMPVVSRIMYQAFATEYKVRDERSRPLSVVLWKIASGTADYREVLREMCGFDVLRSILIGAAVTLRNVAFEVLFGLKWGEYGRYPTVVLKEKREAVKEQLATGLGMELGAVARLRAHVRHQNPGFGRGDHGGNGQVRPTPCEVRQAAIPGHSPVRGRSQPGRIGHSIPRAAGRIGHQTAADQVCRPWNPALSGRREAGGPREDHLQRRADQGRKPQALHLRGVRLQERQELREPDDVEVRSDYCFPSSCTTSCGTMPCAPSRKRSSGGTTALGRAGISHSARPCTLHDNGSMLARLAFGSASLVFSSYGRLRT